MHRLRNIPRLAGRNGLGVLLLATGLAAGCGGSRTAGVETDASLATTCARGGSGDAIAREMDGLRAAAVSDSTEAWWDLHLAEHLRWEGRTDEAMTHLRRALDRTPDAPAALSHLARIHYERGEFDAGIVLLESARDRLGAAFAPELEAGLALHYAALEREESHDTLSHLRAEGAVPDAVAYLMLTGDGYLEALEVARRGVDRRPESAAAHNNLGIALLYAGEAEPAREAFRRALERDPDLAGAMYNLAIVEHVHFFDEGAGREWFARYLEHDDEDPDGLRELFAETEAAR